MQGVVVFIAFLAASPLLALVMKIDAGYEQTFINLMRLQGLIVAFSFTMRPLAQILYAHQRSDLTSLNEIVSLMCQLLLLWIFLTMGMGVYSFVYAGGFYAFIGPAVLFWQCKRLDFWPHKGRRGRASRKIFKDMFAYGKDIFLMGLGMQLTMASQTIIVSRALGWTPSPHGPSAPRCSTWSSRSCAGPLVRRCPASLKWVTRGETVRLRDRFKDMVVLTASLGALLGVGFPLCNSLFIHVWIDGKLNWPPLNDVLLGVWVFLISLTTAHINFVTVTKQIGGMRYVFFLEGCCFVLLASLVGPYWGLPGVIATSLFCTIVFSRQL